MKAVGIDPGLTGALVIIDDSVRPAIIRFFDTPTLTIKSGRKLHRTMDCAELTNILMRELHGDSEPAVIVLEKVSAMPGQGVTSMFNFGMGYGMWQGLLAALQLPFTLVHPMRWKKQIMADMGKEKEAALFRAKQIYPQAAEELSRKKDIGRADALLLAHYGRVFLQAEPIATKAVHEEDFALS